jgi:hypothetical protein
LKNKPQRTQRSQRKALVLSGFVFFAIFAVIFATGAYTKTRSGLVYMAAAFVRKPIPFRDKAKAASRSSRSAEGRTPE